MTRFSILLFLALCTPSNPILAGSTEETVAEVYRAYGNAWLRNDASVPDAVMSLFTDDATIMPHHGDPLRQGREAIAAFWFPGGQVFGRVDRYEQHIAGIEMSGDLAYVFGRFELVFVMEGNRREIEGNQLAVMRRESGGWKIAALTWNDPP